jgi:IS5 family transposase
MLEKRLFSEAELLEKLSQLGDPLEEFKEHIDFTLWQKAADKAVPRGQGAQGGRPPYPTLLMVKILFRKQLYNCGDDQLEFWIADRRSFRRFLDLNDTSATPDAKTIANYNNLLAEAGVGEAFVDAALRQVEPAGYIARGGQMVDASIIPAPKSRLKKDERQALENHEIPENWSKAKVRQHDPDARWTKKHGQSYFGYKLHTNVDHRYKLVRKIKITSAEQGDSPYFEDVLSHNTNQKVIADRGYAKEARETELKAQGLRPRIQRKASRNKPLSECQKRRNQRIAKKRARVYYKITICQALPVYSLVPCCNSSITATLEFKWCNEAYLFHHS